MCPPSDATCTRWWWKATPPWCSSGSATTLQGREYVNEYCWVYTCRDGKIARLEEYADTLYTARVFGTLKS